MRRGRLHRWAELLLLGVGVGVSPALAQSPIQVPEGCGSEEEFRREIRRLTGAAEAFVPSALVIEPVPSEPAGYELRLVIGGELRLLRDSDCRVLWRSAIVIAAAAARGEPTPAPSPAPEPPSLPEPSLPEPPSPGPPAQPVPRAAPAAPRAIIPRSAAVRPLRAAPAAPPRAPAVAVRPRRPYRSVALEPPALGEVRAGLDLGVAVSAGVLPDVGGLLDVGARLEVLPWAVSASLRYWPERSQSRDGRVLEVSAWGARFAGSFRAAAALNLTAGIEINRLVGEGAEGVSGRNADAVWHWAPTAGLSLITWDIRSLRLEIGAAARLSIGRPRFVVTGFGDLYRVPLLGADAIIRGVWLFP